MALNNAYVLSWMIFLMSPPILYISVTWSQWKTDKDLFRQAFTINSNLLDQSNINGLCLHCTINNKAHLDWQVANVSLKYVIKSISLLCDIPSKQKPVKANTSANCIKAHNCSPLPLKINLFPIHFLSTNGLSVKVMRNSRYTTQCREIM